MQIDETVGKGLSAPTDSSIPVIGYRSNGSPIFGIMGGSGNEAPPTPEGSEGVGEGGSEGTVTDSEGQGVQSSETPEGTQASQGTPEGQGGSGETGGQGFLEPYLQDVPEDQRPVVEQTLEKYRQDQDANFNRRFEQLQEETRVPVTLHQALVQDPIQTVDWIAERMKEERGIDLRSELRKRWYEGQEGQPQEGQPSEESSESEDRPLTAKELEEYLDRREQERLQQQQQEQMQQQQIQKQQETVNNWIDDAAKKFSVPLDDAQGEDPLRHAIIMQANQLHESGQAKGQAAIEMAMESVAKRFGQPSSNGNSGNGEGQPRVAEGGTPPPAEQIDVSDPKQRKARMEELFTTPANH